MVKLIDPSRGILGPDGWELHIHARGPLAFLLVFLHTLKLTRYFVIWTKTTAS